MASRALQTWRLIGELDFDAVRREAERPFQVLLAASAAGDAERLALALAGEPHPWLIPRALAEVERGPRPLDLALAVVRGAEPVPRWSRCPSGCARRGCRS